MTGCGAQIAAVAHARPARRRPAPAAATDITICAPPRLARPARAATWLKVLPVALSAAAIPVLALGYRTAPGLARSPVLFVLPIMMLLSAALNALAGRAGGAEVDTDRADYLDYLSGLRSSVTEVTAAQRRELTRRHPEPGTLWTLAGGPQMWERLPGDTDFGETRIGVGPVASACRLVAQHIERPDRADPVTIGAMRRFIATHTVIPAAPIVLPVFALGAVIIDGDRAAARDLLRAMVCQLAAAHGPDVLRVGAVLDRRNRDEWEWLKWLPHHQHPTVGDDTGPVRMTYPTLAEAHAATTDAASGHHSLIVIDRTGPGGATRLAEHSTVVEIRAGPGGPDHTPDDTPDGVPDGADVRLTVRGTTVTVQRSGSEPTVAHADRLDRTDALMCALRLAGYRVDGPLPGAGGGRPAQWLDLIEHSEPVTDGGSRSRLRVPIGTTDRGAPLYLDIKEAAEGGVGPHGLCVGATGSGKSELLRTIALGMMACHSPDTLNLVLVDFKGGATFLGMEGADHVAAVITNLADQAPLVDRMGMALAGELNRRQELLRAAGNVDSAAGYQRARHTDARLAPLPDLFIIVDEFSELLSRHPEFAETFGSIGRLGRSLGVHLLLASQRLDEGRLRGLESHLSYRICLKTLSANESRTVLGVSDAHQLPNTPGAGYLRSATGELVRFHTAFVSGPWPKAPATPDAPVAPTAVGYFTASPSGPAGAAPAYTRVRDASRTVLQTMLDRLSGSGPVARRIWLPPLDVPPRLGGLLAAGAGPAEELVVPIGIVDRPYEQCHTELLVDLRAAAGNVAVVGAPQTGKSTTLTTLVAALAATQDPSRVQVYCLDFGGGALTALAALPQVGAVIGRADPERVRRVVRELEMVCTRREALFHSHGIGSMHHYRRLLGRADPRCADDRFGDVFLVVDGWSVLCREFDALEPAIGALAGRGLAFGVHVVLSAPRWADIRPALRDQIGTRIELRLGEPADSELDRAQARLVPRDRPGRALTDGGLHALIALPDLEGREPLRRGAPAAPPVRLLPAVVSREALIECPATGRPPVLGVEEDELQPVPIPLGGSPHLVVLGDSGCGKTSTLRLLCRELVRTRTAAEVQLLVVDYRRRLLGVVPADHLGGYAMSAAMVTPLLAGLLQLLQQRMPGPDLTAAQLRNTSWWSGPELYLLVDDYDLVSGAPGHPWAPLLDYLPHAVDLGLHVVIARRSGGAARAVYDPLLGALRDLGCTGLIMDGDPDEGPLVGSVRPARLPPGRGTLVTRGGRTRLVQVAWSPPS